MERTQQQYPVPMASGLDLELCGERGSSWKGQGRRPAEAAFLQVIQDLRTQSTVGIGKQ